ncbi:MAG: glycosyltransferase family 1 protein [Armatimonadia bacterium]
MMRVAIDGRLLDVRKTGGTQYTCRLIAGMADLSSDTELVVLRERSSPDLASLGNVREICLPDARLGDEMWEQLRLPTVLRDLQPDVYFAPTSVLPMIRSCPMVSVVYDLGFLQHPEFYAPSLRGYLRKWLPAWVRRADAIVCLASSLRDDLADLVDVQRERVHLVPGAPDEILRRPVGQADLDEFCRSRQLRHPFVLSLSSSEPNKNLPRLVAAFGQSRTGIEDQWQLVLAGPPGAAESQVLEAISQLPHRESVVRLGYVPDEDLPALYQACDIFAFVSLFEGFGLPLLEAMAAGRTIMCSNVNPLTEIAGAAAVTVDPASVDSIEGGLRALMVDSTMRQQLAERASDRAREFSWRRSSEALLRLLRRAAQAEQG